jgi:hypothetical protein
MVIVLTSSPSTAFCGYPWSLQEGSHSGKGVLEERDSWGGRGVKGHYLVGTCLRGGLWQGQGGPAAEQDAKPPES